MVAIAHPSPRPQHQRPGRPDLRLVQGGRSPRRLPSRAVRIRRRRVAALLALAVIAGLLVGAARWVIDQGTAGPLPGGTAPAAANATAPAVYVVHPGDTLWSIARRVAPGADVRSTVDRLAAANGGPTLHVGQQLVLDGVVRRAPAGGGR